MEIIKSKRESICHRCNKIIDLKYKVEGNNKYHYHLSCYFTYLENQIKQSKEYLKEFSKQKYKKQMVIERLK